MLEIYGLDVRFKNHHVVRGVNLTVAKGRTAGLVGESGSGKSTLAKAVVGALRPAGGRITWAGGPVARRQVQLIPQDPYSSLNPRMTVAQTLAEAIEPRRGRVREHRAEIDSLLERVALDPGAATRYPYEFSGGQRQRIAIARALAVKPDLIIADEITSALDCSVQAEILALLAGLREALGLTMLFISHDLAVVQHVSDQVAVMLNGEIVEHGAHVFTAPAHEYTRRLLDSVPRLSIGQ